MLFHGKISTCAPLKLGDGATIYEARVRDASKPLAIRTPGEVSVWMSEDIRKQFPSGDDIEDAEVTVLVREMRPGKNGLIALKGQVVPGLVQPAAFATSEPAPLPQRPDKGQPASAPK